MEGVLFAIDQLGRCVIELRAENDQLREQVTQLATQVADRLVWPPESEDKVT